MIFSSISEVLFSPEGAVLVVGGAAVGVVATKKVEASPRLRGKINAATAKAGETVHDIKVKVHPPKTEQAGPNKADVEKMISYLPEDQQAAARVFVANMASA